MADEAVSWEQVGAPVLDVLARLVVAQGSVPALRKLLAAELAKDPPPDLRLAVETMETVCDILVRAMVDLTALIGHLKAVGVPDSWSMLWLRPESLDSSLPTRSRQSSGSGTGSSGLSARDRASQNWSSVPGAPGSGSRPA